MIARVSGAFTLALLMAGCVSVDQRLLESVATGKAEILRDHPASLGGSPASPELLQLYGRESIPFHCYHMGDAGKIGRITMRGLVHVATGVALPPSVLKGQIPESALAIMKAEEKDLGVVAKPFVDYALRVSGNDPVKARAIVEAAEIHDARCSISDAMELRQQIELAKQNLVLIRDGAGQLIVIKSPEAVPARLIARTARTLELEKPVLKLTADLYELAYAQLRTLNANSDSPKGAALGSHGKNNSEQLAVSRAKEALSIEQPRALHMINAQSEHQASIELARKYCVLNAVPNCV